MPAGIDFLTACAVGALAQCVDGALGMAYGLVSSSLLLALGVPPLAASAGVHAAEVFTCGAASAGHALAGNVDRRLFRALTLPGVAGGVFGALLLGRIPAGTMRLVLAPWLLGMGLFLIARAVRGTAHATQRPLHPRLLGAVVGFIDALAGGGWSALTLTGLLAQGAMPRYAIGSVHAAKFVVSLAVSAGFLATSGLAHGPTVVGLIAGGVLTAPFAALSARLMPARMAILIAGCAVLGLSLHNVLRALR